MTTLDPLDILQKFPVTTEEVQSYLQQKYNVNSIKQYIKRYHLKADEATIRARIRRRLGLAKAKDQLGADESYTYSAANRQLIYGRSKVPGVITFINIDKKPCLGDSNQTFTVTIATPAVFTRNNHGLLEGTKINLTTSGALPTGLAVATNYFVRNPTQNTFNLSATANGALINTTGSQSGTHILHIISDNQFLHLVFTLAGHEIDSVEELWLDNEKVIFGASPDARWSTQFYNPTLNRFAPADHAVFMSVSNGNPSNPANADLIANLPDKWTANHLQYKCAMAYVILKWDPVLFSNGLPGATFVIKGKKIFDPRTSTTAWTDNAALCIADYLNDIYGLRIPYNQMQTDPTKTGNLLDAADCCDETITTGMSTTEKRYTVNGDFDTSVDATQILEQMCGSMAGKIARLGASGESLWHFFPGKWRASNITLTEDDILGSIDIQTKPTQKDNFNGVKGTFISKDKNYVEDDFPIYKNSYYIGLDNGEENFEDVQFKFTTSQSTCQRIAKVEVERVRQGITATFQAGLKAYALQDCDTFQLRLSRLGWAFNFENLLIYSEDFDQSSFWNLVELTLIRNAIFGPLSNTDYAVQLIESTSVNVEHKINQSNNGFISGQNYRVKAYVKPNGRNFCVMGLYNTAFSTGPAIEVNLTGAGAISATAGSLVSSSVTQLTNGWYQIEFETIADHNGDGLFQFSIRPSSGTSLYTGDGTSGVYIWGSYVQRIEADDSYYRTYQFNQLRENSGKLFEVEQSQLVISDDVQGGPTYRVNLTIKETAPKIYDFNNGEETSYDLGQNTNLPDPLSTPTITNLTLMSGTTELYITTDGTVVSRIKASWDPIDNFFVSSGGQIEIQAKLSSVTNWSDIAVIPGNQSFYHILDVQDGAYYDVRIRARTALGIEGAYITVLNHLVIGKTAPPSDVTGINTNIRDFVISVNWLEIPDLDRDFYILKVGASDDTWADMQEIARPAATSYETNLRSSGTYKFAVKAVDTSGNESVNEDSVILSINGPSAVTPSFSFDADNIILSWTVPASQFQIQTYLIKYGDTYGAATGLSSVRGTTLRVRVDWLGNRRFWVVAVDVAGNEGTPASIDVVIAQPGMVQNLTSQIVDNNILLRWQAPIAGSLPIEQYELRKGTVFATAEVIGIALATFLNNFERIGGTYTYWVVAVDTAGNYGIEAGITATVNQPPDYILRADEILPPEMFDVATNILAGINGTFLESFDPATIEGCVLDLSADENISGAESTPAVGWTDRSENHFAFSNGTLASEPILTRIDNQENRVTKSETLTNLIWTKTNVTVTADQIAGPLSTTNLADKVLETVTNGAHEIKQTLNTFANLRRYRFSAYFKAISRTKGRLYVDGSAFTTGYYADFDLSGSGSITGSNTTVTPTIEDLGNTWFRVSFVQVATSTNTAVIHAAIENGSGTLSYVGDVTKGMYIFGLQAQEEAASETYLVTDDYPAYRGKNGHRGLFFDGLDDFLSISPTPSELNLTGDATIIVAAYDENYGAVSTNSEIISCETYQSEGWLLRYDADNSRQTVFRTSQSGTSSSIVNTTAFSIDDFSVITAIKSSNSRVLIENADPQTGTINAPDTITNDLFIGLKDQAFMGRIHRILIFNRELTFAELELIYKKLKWEIQDRPDFWSDSLSAGSFFAPVTLDDTWSDHFTDNSWMTIGDQIGDGFPFYLQPTDTPATIEEIIDYGGVLNATVVNVSWLENLIAGNCTVQCDIGDSLDNITYNFDNNITTILKNNFRYLKIRLTITASDNTGLIQISNLNVRLDVKQKNDGGGPITAPLTNFSQVATISIASPAVVTSAAHGLAEGTRFYFTTVGTLPSGLTPNTDYFVRNPATNTFNVSLTPTGPLINTSGIQAGVHTIHVLGVPVFFNINYLDVDSITATPNPTPTQILAGSLPFSPILNFADEPNPKSFNVYFLDRTGAQVECNFRWASRGV